MEHWKDIIKTCVEEAGAKFEKNELAFLALQGKIELQLRDKIAWLLQQKYGDKYYIKKEYKRHDLAILDDNLNPKCLVEFKAHSSAKWEDKYKKFFEKDLAKMRNTVENGHYTDVQLFYVFFQTIHTKTFRSKAEKVLVPYSSVINQGVEQKAENTLKEQWEKICSSESGELLAAKIEAGKYLDDEVTIHAMIFGSKQ